MKSFFTMILIVGVFTILSSFRFIKFEVMQSENIAKESYEFFFYLYLFLIGALAASSYKERSRFRRFIKKFTDFTKPVYMGFSGSLVGWGIGLLLYVLVTGKFGSMILGLVLTSIIVIFTLAPAWYHEQIEAQRRAMIGFMFKEPRFAKLLNCIGWMFMLVSIFGFYDFFMA